MAAVIASVPEMESRLAQLRAELAPLAQHHQTLTERLPWGQQLVHSPFCLVPAHALWLFMSHGLLFLHPWWLMLRRQCSNSEVCQCAGGDAIYGILGWYPRRSALCHAPAGRNPAEVPSGVHHHLLRFLMHAWALVVAQHALQSLARLKAHMVECSSDALGP